MRDSVYWGKIKIKLKEILEPGDELVLVAEHMKEDQSCDLCGCKPITKIYVLENKRTFNKIIVGSECINNYPKVVNELRSEWNINLINKKYPGTIEREESLDYDKDNIEREEEITESASEGMGMDDMDNWRSE
jgi:hypothetical protein